MIIIPSLRGCCAYASHLEIKPSRRVDHDIDCGPIRQCQIKVRSAKTMNVPHNVVEIPNSVMDCFHVTSGAVRVKAEEVGIDLLSIHVQNLEEDVIEQADEMLQEHRQCLESNKHMS